MIPKSTPPRVLVIDDDENFLLDSTYALGKFAKPVTALGGKDGLLKFDQGEWDVVIFDYHMPVIDGLDVLKTIRQKDKFVATVMHTGQGTTVLAHKAMALGVDRYLVKGLANPTEFTDLVSALVTLTRQRREQASGRGLQGTLEVLSGRVDSGQTMASDLSELLSQGEQILTRLRTSITSKTDADSARLLMEHIHAGFRLLAQWNSVASATVFTDDFDLIQVAREAFIEARLDRFMKFHVADNDATFPLHGVKPAMMDALIAVYNNAREAGAQNIWINTDGITKFVIDNDGRALAPHETPKLNHGSFSSKSGHIGTGLPGFRMAMRVHGFSPPEFDPLPGGPGLRITCSKALI